MSNSQPLWTFVLCVSKDEGQIWPFCQKARHISGHLFTLAQCLCVSPCSESHPLLRLSVYMAVYCGLAREKQRKTAAQMKQKQQITQSITQWQCAYLKCCQYSGVHVAESKMLITSRHFWENYITCTRCEHLSSSDIIKKYSTSYNTFLNWKHSQF